MRLDGWYLENKYSNELQKIHPESGGTKWRTKMDERKSKWPMAAHQLFDKFGAVMHATPLCHDWKKQKSEESTLEEGSLMKLEVWRRNRFCLIWMDLNPGDTFSILRFRSNCIQKPVKPHWESKGLNISCMKWAVDGRFWYDIFLKI